jgi:hypothetical protein
MQLSTTVDKRMRGRVRRRRNVTLFAAFPAIGQIFRRDRRMLVRLAGLFVITLLGVVSVLGVVVWLLAMVFGVGTLWRRFRIKPFFESA